MRAADESGVTQMVGPAVGDEVEATIERLAYGGEGVARVEGLVVFIPWTAPGERVRARIVERHSSWARAHLAEVMAPGLDRVEPGCPLFGICGGCQLQHLAPAAQLAAKARAVSDAFDRIAGRGLPGGIVCESAARPWHYRQRAALTWRWSAGGLALGFHTAADPDSVVPVASCPILAEAGNARLAAFARALEKTLEEEEAGALEGRLVVRAFPGNVQVGVFAPEPALASRLAQACGGTAGVSATWGHWAPDDRRLALAADAPRLAIRVPYRGLNLRVGFDSFLQVDLDAAEGLYDAVLEGLAAKAGERVIDGYAGVGIIACQLAARGITVTAVESHPGAASDLRANAAATGGEVHVLELPAERVDWRRPRPHAVILNPPRGGCPPAALASIARSPARRLVYVACDPTTLARDVRRLGAGWRLDGVRAFDLFPQTAHVETVARLSRGEAA